MQPLNFEETSRFEALSKGFYEDFYTSSHKSPAFSQQQQTATTTPPLAVQPPLRPFSDFPKREVHTPTDVSSPSCVDPCPAKLSSLILWWEKMTGDGGGGGSPVMTLASAPSFADCLGHWDGLRGGL